MTFTGRDSATDHLLPSASRKAGFTVRAKLLGLVIVASLFSACSDDSVNTNPVDPAGNNLVANDTTQQLRNEIKLFYDNVYHTILDTKCNICHNRSYNGDSSNYPFADPSVVVSYNFALTNYAAGVPFFDLQDPANSRVVAKVSGGHNVWDGLSPAVAAQALQDAIQNWADALNNNGGGGGGGTTTGNTANLELIDLLSVPTDALEPTPIKQLPDSGTQAYTTALDAYTNGVHGLVLQYCSRCHNDSSSTPQRPYFAVTDAEQSMLTMIENQKMDLEYPTKSRIYLRLITDNHNCWSNCSSNGTTMLNAINSFVNSLPAAAALPANWVNSKTRKLEDGISVNSGTPYEAYMIAKYKFDDQSNQADLNPNVRVNTASDSAPNGAGVTFTLGSSVSWLGGWGVELSGVGSNSKITAVDSASNSARQNLINSIKQFDEFSVEAWVSPGNVSQGSLADPAIIFSLAEGDQLSGRTLVLGQAEYRYVFYTDLDSSSAATASIDTGNGDVVQATLQHVVVTYHHSAGRKIFVNGQLVLNDATPPGSLPYTWGTASDNNATYATIGATSAGSLRFQGKVRMLRMYNRSITAQEVQQNFDAGVGQKFALLFKVGHLDNDPVSGTSNDGLHEDTYVMLTMEDFDDYSYKVYDPRLVVLNAENGLSDTGSIALAKMEIGINGKIPEAGQAYSRLDTNIGWSLEPRPNATPANSKRSLTSILNTSQYNFITGTAGSGTTITAKASGTIIPKNVNVDTDQFFLKFAKLGSATDVTVPGAVVLYNPSYDLLASSIDTNNALRNFDAIYASMVQMTGVNVNQTSAADTSKTIAQLYFDDIRATLPTVADAATYVAPNQVSVTRLAYEFCEKMGNTGSILGVPVNVSVNQTTANNLAVKLAEQFLGSTATPPGNSSAQSTVVNILVNQANDNVDPQLDTRDLFTKFNDSQVCETTCATDAARMTKIAKAMCISALASASIALH